MFVTFKCIFRLKIEWSKLVFCFKISLKIIGNTNPIITRYLNTTQWWPSSGQRINATTLYCLTVDLFCFFFSYFASLPASKNSTVRVQIHSRTSATRVSDANRLFTNMRGNKWQFWPKHFRDKKYIMYVCFWRSRERMHYFALHGCLNIQFIYGARVKKEKNIFFTSRKTYFLRSDPFT